MSEGRAADGEGKRAVIATALGLALGIVAALFSRGEDDDDDRRRRGWRGRSAI